MQCPGGGSGGAAGRSSLWIHGFRLGGWTQIGVVNLNKANTGIPGSCWTSCSHSPCVQEATAGLDWLQSQFMYWFPERLVVVISILCCSRAVTRLC